MKQILLDFSDSVRSKDARSVYYLLTFLSDFSISLIAAIYSLFLLSKGLDLFQINLVNVAFMAGNFVFEIPTGAYADYFGRRNSVIISNILIIMTMLTYFLANSLPFFILAELFAALSFTFASGALDAWMVDSLEKSGYVGKVDFVFSQANIIGRLASILGGLIGAYLAIVNLAMPFGIGAVVALAALAVLIFFTDEKSLTRQKLNLSQTLAQISSNTVSSIRYALSHRVILWLSICSAIAFFAFMPLNMYWSPRFNSMIGNQVWLLGWAWALIAVAMMFGSYLAKQFLKKEKAYVWILVVTALLLSLPVLMSALSGIFALAFSSFLLYEVGRGLHKPTYSAYINKFIPSEQRATILSFDSMISRIGAILGLLVLGWVGKTYSIETAWLMSGMLLLILIPFYLQTGKLEKQLKS